jgi:hypothetical protein
MTQLKKKSITRAAAAIGGALRNRTTILRVVARRLLFGDLD